MLEQLTTGLATRVLVNSKFTQSVFLQTFPYLAGRPFTVKTEVANRPRQGTVCSNIYFVDDDAFHAKYRADSLSFS